MKKLAIILALGSKLALADPAVKCTAVMSTPFGTEVKIESATQVPATATLPEHCDVRGTIWPEAKFAVKLPAAWNHRFQMVGNSGTAGDQSGAMDPRAAPRLRHGLHRYRPRLGQGTRVLRLPQRHQPERQA